MAKFEQKIEARNLRKEGKSIKQIAKELNVSTSSVSGWCQDIVLSEDQILELEKHARDPNYGRRLENSLRQRRERILKTEKLMKDGVKEIGSITRRELFIAGIALYWAEGFKKDNQVGFANSDPGMINFYIKWLYKCCGIKLQDLNPRATVNISHKNRINVIQKYWSEATRIPSKNFGKPFYQNTKWKKVYENPNEYYGVLRVRVRRSTDLLRKIHGWVEGLKLQA